MNALAGVDGCKAGWVAVWQLSPERTPQTAVFATIAELVTSLPAKTIIALDMPIGLPDFITNGGRGPEQAVRPFLKSRQFSVFSVPSRAAVYAECGPFVGMDDMIKAHKRASNVALTTSNPPRKISIQAFNLFPKIRELDLYLQTNPQVQDRIHESHPEFAFTVLNGGQPMSLPKKIKGKVNADAMAERRRLLAAQDMHCTFLEQKPPKGANADDFLDACAMMLMAGRIFNKNAQPHPLPLQYDSKGLPIAIWA